MDYPLSLQMTALRIANSRGVPGTAGAIGYTLHDGRPVLLSTWHVLFGRGADCDEDVWLGEDVQRIGRVLYGKIGSVQLGDETIHVDCAVASCGDLREPRALGHDTARVGDLVTKCGAATGITTGVVVSVEESDVVTIDGRAFAASRQVLVRSLESDRPFSAEGDSGALLINASGRAVGLLWGTNHRGEGVACPIAAVLYAMNITLS